MSFNAKNFFDAIVKDDLEYFLSIEENDWSKFRFGRFPVLSIMYLFGAKKLLLKYEPTLLQISDYPSVLDEPYVLINKFSSVAKKALRLYWRGDLVTPCEMLLIIDRTSHLKKIYPYVRHSPALRKNLTKIYYIKYGLKLSIDGDVIMMERRPLKKSEKNRLLVSTISAILVLAIAISTPLLVNALKPTDTPNTDLDSGNNGDIPTPPTGNEPNLPSVEPTTTVNVSSLSEIDFANKDTTYVLQNDIVIDTDINVENIQCHMNGNGKTITVTAFNNKALFDTISGSLANVNVDFGVLNSTFSNAFGMLVNTNSGTIKNVNVKVKGTINTIETTTTEVTATDEVNFFLQSLIAKNYTTFSPICYVNNGLISECTVDVDLTLSGVTSANSAFCSTAVINSSYIENCSLSGSVTSDTVDLVGICVFNRYSISGCSNLATLSQTSNVTTWSPIVSGIAQTALSPNPFTTPVITSCTNSGNLTITNTSSTITESKISGILFENYGAQVVKCTNTANLTINSDFSNCVTSGIVCYNREYTTINDIGAYESTNSGSINVSTKKGVVLTSGICAHNLTDVNNCTNSGNITVTQTHDSFADETDDVIYVGGVVANNSGYVDYSTNTASITASSLNTDIYIGGAVAVSNGNVRYCKSSGNLTSTVTDSVSHENEESQYAITYLGGVLGYNVGSISYSNSSGALTATSSNLTYLGGVIGFNYYISAYLMSEANLVANVDTSTLYVGGIAGINAVYNRNETIVASQVIQSIASGKITVNCTSVAHVGGIVGANDSLVVNENGYSGYLQNNFSLCTYELSEGVSAGGIVGRAGKYGYDNNYHTSGNNAYYYYKDNYFLQLESPLYGIRALLPTDTDQMLEEGYTLSTTPATNEEINANETFKKIINLFY